ncbi:MAG: pyridoxamine 5'-phosphate oxidase family protein [Microbacteriaceae bacterium]|nr:MAG: pyridoxamine 5'-phosphate oxidase family protein [Microbacteriaceae bacterium]
MGKTIDMNSLADTAAQYGFAYLITVGDDSRIHTSAVNPVVTDAALTVPRTSAHSRANADRNPNVSLVWPPTEDGGYSLIVDGEARASDDSDDRALGITPSRAVLHRPVPRPGPMPDDSSCQSDCVEL